MKTTDDPATPPARSVRVIFAALLLVMLLASLDQTIVSTALPTIVGELGGLEHLSWVVTAYLLATTVVTPLYGKLGDLYGRKVVLQAAVVIFLLGSMLCGIAQSMVGLIIFRFLQGLGGGGLMVTAMAVVGDIIPPRERGRYQGIFGAVFGVSTVLGPLLGGFFVSHLSWRWIFYVNLPLGVLALTVIAIVFHAPGGRRRHRVDYLGAALLAGALTAVVLFTSLGGSTLPWGAAPMLGLAVLGIGLTGGFLAVERRAAEPMLPLGLFGNRIFSTASAISLIVGLGMFGAVTFIPLFLQVVKGQSPLASGLQMTPMMAGMLLTSIVSGQLISRLGRYRMFPIFGTLVTTLGLGLLSGLTATSSVWTASLYLLVMGLGLGMVMQVLILAVQNAVDYQHLGVATSGVTLFRSIGGSLGVSAFGAIFANQLQSNLARWMPAGSPLPAAVDPTIVQQLPAALHAPYIHAFAVSLRPVFLAAAVVTAVGFLLSWLLREVPLRKAVQAQGVGESFAMPRDADSLSELELIVDNLAQRQNRAAVYVQLAQRAGVDLPPAQLWLLARISERPRTDQAALAQALRLDTEELAALLAQLRRRRLLRIQDDGTVSLTAGGRRAIERLVRARRDALAELLAGWNPDEHAAVRELLDRLARTLVTDMPLPPGARLAATS